MKTEKINQTEMNFKAQISPEFEKFMRSYINYGGERLKNNYRLNQKIADLNQFGYDNYTINLANKLLAWGNEYSLVATKNGQNLKDGIVIAQKNSVKSIIKSFLYMTKGFFKYKIMQNQKYNP